MADRFTTIGVMRTLRAASHHCFMLESAENNQPWSRYSFLGYDPTLEITCLNGHLTITKGVDGEQPEITKRKSPIPVRKSAGSFPGIKARNSLAFPLLQEDW